MGARTGQSLIATLCVWLLLMSCERHVFGASEGFLTLPEPSLVNDILLANCSNWTNPVLKEQTPSPLQVIKCQSFSENGPRYDFYQVQPPDHACEVPPHRVYITHRHSVAVWDNKWQALRAFVSLTVWSSFVIIVGGFIVLACMGTLFPARNVSDSQRQSVKLEESSHRQDASSEAEAVLSKVLEGGKEPDSGTGHAQERRLKKEANLRAFWRWAEHASLCVFIICGMLAAKETPRAIRCSVQETVHTFVGPVGLPNPE